MPSPPTFLLNETAIAPPPPAWNAEHGAVVEFFGVVREMEDGRPLAGIRYTGYAPMAQAMLANLLAEAEARFGPHGLWLQHRLGFVAVAEPSVGIRVGARHSREAFEICQHYLRAVKTTLPIWKEAVYARAPVAA